MVEVGIRVGVRVITDNVVVEVGIKVEVRVIRLWL